MQRMTLIKLKRGDLSSFLDPRPVKSVSVESDWSSAVLIGIALSIWTRNRERLCGVMIKIISEIVCDYNHTSLQGLLPLDLGHRILNIHRLSSFSLR